MSRSLELISKARLSIWLDDLSRERLKGSLREMIEQMYVVGVTTNPAIFSAAISGSDLYRDEILALASQGLDESAIVRHLTTSDVRDACDLFANLNRDTGGVDGRVSIEVDPELARDSERTIAEGVSLWSEVDRKNLLIKVPATREGLLAIEELTARGISVNVTLIFTPLRYQEVIDAYFTGLERRIAEKESIAGIHSVASFFVSRIDTEIDRRLKEAHSSEDYSRLRGKAGVANAINAYSTFMASVNSDRWRALRDQGAQLQRPLWASTGVKDPAYSPTLYVDRLITPDSVNTMPEKTLHATAQLEGEIEVLEAGSMRFQEASQHMAELMKVGIEIEAIGQLLESEGLEKFVSPWRDLHDEVRKLITE